MRILAQNSSREMKRICPSLSPLLRRSSQPGWNFALLFLARVVFALDSFRHKFSVTSIGTRSLHLLNLSRTLSVSFKRSVLLQTWTIGGVLPVWYLLRFGFSRLETKLCAFEFAATCGSDHCGVYEKKGTAFVRRRAGSGGR